ncbi:MAG TPA: NADH-quinone oxidoreductase subunit M [Roseiflexaceae bacterium]|nr:NADH-quinone oxidoreductase subunit M [Roseiflexaceae bacterium]
MNQIGFPLVSLIVWLPALGALLLWLLPRDNTAAGRIVALAAAIGALVAAVPLYILFDPSQAGYQLVDRVGWVSDWGLYYSVSVDGISLWLVLLTVFLTPIALLASWGSDVANPRLFQGLILLLASGMTGVFVAQDMLLFYMFFEFTLVPTALLIGMWGSDERRAAAIKFFVYTFAGSVFMLLGIIGLYLIHGQQTGVYTFDLATLLASLQLGAIRIDPLIEQLLFLAFFIAFAVKVPIWPFHTWMTTAHAEAPVSGVVDVAGMMLKIGAYGLIRFNVQLFPNAAAWAAPAVGVLAVITILYSAWVAYGQSDLKRLLAYASVSHLGFIVLGIFALTSQGIAGAVVQMVNSGVTTSALFLIVGMLAARSGERDISSFGGLWGTMPVLGSLTLIMVLASIGLPGLNGFVGEFTILLGAWLSPVLGWGFVLLAVLGVILSAAYLLRMFRLVFMGEVPAERAAMPDLQGREAIVLGALLVPTVVVGLYPNILFGPMQVTMQQLAQTLTQTLASR